MSVHSSPASVLLFLWQMSRSPRLLELFSGSSSLGNVAKNLGWDVVSLDILSGATVCVDITTCDLSIYGIFDWVHASPPCQEYSRCKTRAPRDIESANIIAGCARHIIDQQIRLNPRLVYTIENPATGLLKDQLPVKGLPWYDTAYCCYGFPYRKLTRIWSNMALLLPTCASHCQYGGNHPLSVQNSPVSIRSRIPPGLCYELVISAIRHLNLPLPRVPLGHVHKAKKDLSPKAKTGLPKVCSNCHTNRTDRWYAGPLCRTCYRRKQHSTRPASETPKGPENTLSAGPSSDQNPAERNMSQTPK